MYAYVHNPNTWIDPFGLLEEWLYAMRVQIQTGTTNIVSKAINSNIPITATQLESAMKEMISALKGTEYQNLTKSAHGAASHISKLVRQNIVGNGGISQGQNVMRTWLR